MILYIGILLSTVLMVYVFVTPYRGVSRMIWPLLVICTLGPGVVYLQLGSPHLADHPFSSHLKSDHSEREVALLSHKIAGYPTDSELWKQLGKGLTEYGYYREAAKALEHARALEQSITQKAPKALAR